MSDVTDFYYGILHQCCPTCGYSVTDMTTIGVIEVPGREFKDDVNIARCHHCRWAGKVHDLVQTPWESLLFED